MKETFEFDAFNSKLAIKYAKAIAGKQFTNEMAVVIDVAFRDKRNLPSLRFKEANVVPLKDYMVKWVKAYLIGYNNRPSVRTGNKSNTYSDPIIKLILGLRLPKVSTDLCLQVEGGHSLMMTIENLVGDLLEEYLSIKLKKNGWCCCWGSTIDAVDFCKADGRIIQIKNSDNSENSSSSKVRNGTTIEKWQRRKSTKENEFFWKDLNGMLDRKDLSEEDFQAFVSVTIKNNPTCLFVDDGHSLNKL